MLKAKTKGAARSAAFGADQTNLTCKIWQRAAALACAGLYSVVSSQPTLTPSKPAPTVRSKLPVPRAP